MIGRAVERLALPSRRLMFARELYANARRRGLGVRRACFATAYALGVPAKQIAYAFERKVTTVRWHLREVYRSLRVGDKAELTGVLVRPLAGQARFRPKRYGDHPFHGRGVATRSRPRS